MPETPSNQDQIVDTCQKLISEHENLRNKFGLPDLNSLFENSYTSYDQQLLDYYHKLRFVAESHGLPLYKSPIFFQEHPNLGSFYQPKLGVILFNPGKIGTLIDETDSKYDRREYLIDLTQEIARGLIHKSDPEISNQDLARQSVISVCFSKRITPDFVANVFPALIQENFQTHQQITA